MIPRRFLAGVGALTIAAALGACSSSKKASTSPSSAQSGSPTTAQSSGSTAAPAQGAPIKVGLICGCSGAYGNNETAVAQVYKAWVNTVNGSGGLEGHPVDLTTIDDKTLPGNSVTAAQTLISDHVDAIADDTILDSTWASAVQAAGIPVVGVLTPNPLFDTNPDFYAEGQTTSNVVPAIAAIAKEAGATNLGVIYCAESPQCSQLISAVKSAAQAVGIPSTFSASISATAPNYTAQCLAAQQAHVTALVVFDVEQPNIKLGTNCSQQGYSPIYITEGTGFSIDQAKAPGLRDKLWTQYSDLPFWDNAPEVQAMNAAVDKYYPGLRNNPVDWQEGAAQAWPSALLLADAVKAGGLGASDTPSATEIVKGLDSLHGDTLNGWAPPLTFQAGKANPIKCYFVGRVQNGTPSLVGNGAVCPSS